MSANTRVWDDWFEVMKAEGRVARYYLADNVHLNQNGNALMARLIKPLGIRVTRIASGLPVGGDLEFADEVTLGRALEARREI